MGKRKQKKKAAKAARGEIVVREIDAISVDDLPDAQMSSGGGSVRYDQWDGTKFSGGFGPTSIFAVDYWTLRARSSQLYKENLYARGMIRRLVTNEINTGLHLEATPEEKLLGEEQDGLAEWSEDVESRFAVWGKTPRLSDQREQITFGAMQAIARQEALVAGDVLVTMQQDQRTRLPRIKLVNGAAVQTPFDAKPRNGNRIVHGVELDSQDRHVAYWIQQSTKAGALQSKRLPAFGEKTGRRLAWLMYGTDKRLDDVRGEPILSLILQSLKEIDRYRDAVLRKAVVNSFLAMFVTKDADKMGSRPLTGNAMRKGTNTTIDTKGQQRTFNAVDQMPGLIIDELQTGEKPMGMNNVGTDEKFGPFEEAIIQGIAWANNIPPEILRLSFSNNYSASQAAINEFKIYLNAVRTSFGEQFCQPVYNEWLLSEVLNQKVPAHGLLEAWRNPRDHDIFAAWISSGWAGHVKPAVDLSKLVKGYVEMIAAGLITRDRAARELTGMKFSKNVVKLAIENEMLAQANKSLEPEPVAPPAAESPPQDIDAEPIDDEGDGNQERKAS